MSKAYRLLIGSVGDDSHSVGINLLTIAFKEAGFYVKNLGIMNTLDDFFYDAKDFEAILISCMNGHIELYLDGFPQKLHSLKVSNDNHRVWYLGGNLSVQHDNDTVIRKYLSMGFDFVAPKPITFNTLMANLLKDFDRKSIKKKATHNNPNSAAIALPSLGEVNDDQMSDREFSLLRKGVLNSWPTGAQVWQADVKKNHSDPSKNFNNLICHTLTNSRKPLLQPRTGVAHLTNQLEILHYLRKNGLDISSIQLDAASRKNMYHKAEEGVFKTAQNGNSFLNGFPVPVHGVSGIEKIVQSIDTPFQIRAGSPDHRLVYEIALAGGASSVEGGFICYLYPYDKDTSPVTNLMNWKYVDKLVNWYYKEYQIIVNREYFGPLTCCLIEPAIPICINIVQAILSAKSGAQCISVGLAEQGNRSQDIAAITVLDKMTRQYLAKYNLSCTLSTVFHQYMAAFPTDIQRARDLIVHSATTGTLSHATRIMTKTPVESIHIPTKEDNAEGLHFVKKGVQNAASITPDWELIGYEMRILEREVISLMKSIEMLGNGSVARGIIRAFQNGTLDIPFSPSKFNKNNLLTARDCDGAIRFINPELLPFDEDIIDFHKEKIHRRMISERSAGTYDMLERDLTRIWKNDYKTWPLDGTYIS